MPPRHARQVLAGRSRRSLLPSDHFGEILPSAQVLGAPHSDAVRTYSSSPRSACATRLAPKLIPSGDCPPHQSTRSAAGSFASRNARMRAAVRARTWPVSPARVRWCSAAASARRDRMDSGRRDRWGRTSGAWMSQPLPVFLGLHGPAFDERTHAARGHSELARVLRNIHDTSIPFNMAARPSVALFSPGVNDERLQRRPMSSVLAPVVNWPSG